jgi:hypothetical protein
MARGNRIAAVVATTALLMGTTAVGVVAIQQTVSASGQSTMVSAEAAPATAAVDVLTVLPPVTGTTPLPSLKKILKPTPARSTTAANAAVTYAAVAAAPAVAPAAAPAKASGEQDGGEHENEHESDD